MARFWRFLPSPVEASEMKVFQAGVEYIKMTIIREWPKAWSGGGGLASPSDAACPQAALHLESRAILPGSP